MAYDLLLELQNHQAYIQHKYFGVLHSFHMIQPWTNHKNFKLDSKEF